MNEEAFADVQAILQGSLEAVPLAGDRLLEASAQRRLTGSGVIFPEWLAIRSFSFCWRFQSRFDGARTRFLLWDNSASAREMLDAEIRVQVRPAPFDEPPPRQGAGTAAAKLYFPRLLARDVSPEAFQRIAPEGATPEATTILRLGEDTLACSDAPDDGESEIAHRIRVRWTSAGSTWDIGPGGSWPVAMFLSLTRALASPEAGLPGDGARFDSLDEQRDAWQLAGHGLRLGASMGGWLDAPRDPLKDPALEAMRLRWAVDGFSVRAGALVNGRGELAHADEDDTFLAPFRIASEEGAAGRQLSLLLELPDVLARDELRRELLQKFADEADFADAARQLNEALSGNDVSESALRAWCDPENERAQVLRVDRKRDGRVDEYLLVIESFAGGTRVAVLIHADKVVLEFVDGQWSVPGFGRSRVIFAGLADRQDLEWDQWDWQVFRRVPRAQLFAEVLAILLRWRALL